LQVCPFFATKVIAEEADIVFMPYNYVTEDVSSMQKLLAGAVLILDEAHNVESVCQDTASFDLSSGALPYPFGHQAQFSLSVLMPPDT